MSKLKYINKKGQVSITLKLVSTEQINSGMAGYLAGNYIKGFLRPAADKGGGIIYSGAQGMALSQFLRHPINKEQFYIIIAHLLEAYKMIVSVNLDPSMIVLDPDYITISPNTGELYLVYQPIINSQSPNQGFMRCFGQICSMLKYSTPQDQAAIGGFIAYAGRLPAFSVNDIERYILNVSPATYNIVMRMPFNDPLGSPVPAAAEPPISKKPSMTESAPSGTVLASDDMYAAPVETMSSPQTLNRSSLSDFSPRQDIPAEPEIAPQIPEQPSLSDFSPKEDVYEAPAEPVIVPEIIEEPVSSEITQKEEPVPVVPAEPEPMPPAKLTRRSNGEVILINKETFVIGKERARVNGCITGNKAVSRVHATIMLKPDGFYIVDNDSTNKTYINGSVIYPMNETKINSGDIIKLANEEFDFFTL
ncbi:MAG: FHA domain-containing protein [Ruminococcus sp.]|nr:FHA domain-containing protein [Ruminococcus sp.]